MQPESGGRSHPKLNISARPIAKKYSDGKVIRTLKRRSKVLEIVKRETNVTGKISWDWNLSLEGLQCLTYLDPQALGSVRRHLSEDVLPVSRGSRWYGESGKSTEEGVRVALLGGFPAVKTPCRIRSLRIW